MDNERPGRQALEAAVAEQGRRRAQVVAWVREKLIEPRAVRVEGGAVYWEPYGRLGDNRLALWLGRLLLDGDEGERGFANELIEHAAFDHACHFCGHAAAAICKQYGERLTEAAAEHLKEFLLGHTADWMTDDFRFHGANDNAPLGCVAALALAGELFDRPALTEFARERLAGLDRLLDLRGYIHECNSPTYSAVSLMYLADLAEFCEDEAIRRMALRGEQRIWQEVLLHYHPAIGSQVGPFSRAYEDDLAGQGSMVSTILWCVFGAISPFNPETMLFPPPRGTFAHNPWTFQYGSLAGRVTPRYHPPLELAAACLNRGSEFSVCGGHEFMPRADRPCGQSRVQMYATRRYGVGSFGARLFGGQSTSAHLLYRRNEVAAEAPIEEYLAATRSVYTRCTVSERFAGQVKDADRAEWIKEDIADDQAAAFTVQERGTVMIAYTPSFAASFTRHQAQAQAQAVRTIRASVILPIHHSRPEEIWCADQRVDVLSWSSSEPSWTFVRDGDIYLAVLPLLARTRDTLLCKQQYLCHGEQYATISAYNVASFDALMLDEQALRVFGNGFVIEIASRDEWPSFEAFRRGIAKARVQQRCYQTQRELRYQREGVDLELVYDWRALVLRRAASGNVLHSAEAPLQTDPPMALVH